MTIIKHCTAIAAYKIVDLYHKMYSLDDLFRFRFRFRVRFRFRFRFRFRLDLFPLNPLARILSWGGYHILGQTIRGDEMYRDTGRPAAS